MARHSICLEIIARNYDRLNKKQVLMSGRFYPTLCDRGCLVCGQLSEDSFFGAPSFWEATNVAVLRGKTARPITCGSVPSFKADDGTGTNDQLVLCFFWNKKKKLMMAVLTRI